MGAENSTHRFPRQEAKQQAPPARLPPHRAKQDFCRLRPPPPLFGKERRWRVQVLWLSATTDAGPVSSGQKHQPQEPVRGLATFSSRAHMRQAAVLCGWVWGGEGCLCLTHTPQWLLFASIGDRRWSSSSPYQAMCTSGWVTCSQSGSGLCTPGLAPTSGSAWCGDARPFLWGRRGRG